MGCYTVKNYRWSLPVTGSPSMRPVAVSAPPLPLLTGIESLPYVGLWLRCTGAHPPTWLYCLFLFRSFKRLFLCRFSLLYHSSVGDPGCSRSGTFADGAVTCILLCPSVRCILPLGSWSGGEVGVTSIPWVRCWSSLLSLQLIKLSQEAHWSFSLPEIPFRPPPVSVAPWWPF